jgi:hypothetical protein
MKITSKTENSTDSSATVPTVNIVVSKGMGTPGNRAASGVVSLSLKDQKGKELPDTELISIELKDTNLVNSVNLPNTPPWKLTVTLFNTTKLKSGDRIYINVFLSFNDSLGDRIPAGKINEGDWFLPIIVTDGTNDYLLAQVHVTIKTESSKANETDESSNKTAVAKPVAGAAQDDSKDAVAKFAVEISPPKLVVEVSTLKPA